MYHGQDGENQEALFWPVLIKGISPRTTSAALCFFFNGFALVVDLALTGSCMSDFHILEP
jgi:hypothetical protein